MLNILLPFVVLSTASLLFSQKYKFNLTKSYLICILFITFFIFLVGNFVSLKWSIYLIFLFLGSKVFYNLIYKKSSFSKKNLKQIIFISLPVFILIILYSSNLFFYKYDEFSEYGIISKLIFSENELMNNINNIMGKGSPHKINIMGYLNYFFLKTSYLKYDEHLIYIAQNTLNIIIISNILEFVSGRKIKFFFFIIIYLLCFTLSTGFDRIYLDITSGLLTGLIITTHFLSKEKNKYLIIFMCMIFLFCLKTSTSLIFIGLILIFSTISIINKEFKVAIFYASLIFFSFFIEKIYISNLHLKNLSSQNDFNSKILLINRSYQLNYENNLKNSFLFYKGRFDLENFKKLLKKNFSELNNKGIYHAKTFLIPNKIFEKTNINFRLIEIPIVLFIWILFMLILFRMINLEKKSIVFLTLYIMFIFTFWVILILWGWQNNLANKDFTIEISWQRHLGIIIFGIISYLLVLFFRNKKINNISFILIFVILLSISSPRSLKIFFSQQFVLKDNFWSQKFYQRDAIKKLSILVKKNIPKYSNLIYSIDEGDSYYFPILNYELIHINLHRIEINNLKKINNLPIVDDKKNNTFLLIDSNKSYLINNNNLKMENIKFLQIFTNNKVSIYRINQI